MQFTLYLVTNTKCPYRTQYIGKTVQQLSKRWASHLYYARRGSKFHLHRAIRKYGTEAFTLETIHTVAQDEESLNEWEMFFIAALRKAGRLYNLTNGGEGVSGHIPSDKQRAAYSVAMKIRCADLEFKKKRLAGLAKKNSDPVFAAESAERSRKRHLEPRFRKKLSLCHWAKLKESDIPVIRHMREDGHTCQEIADAYSVSDSAIWNIIQRISWKHIK